MKYCIGIDIGGTKCSVVSADVSKITLDPHVDFLTKCVFETDVFDYRKMVEKFCACIDEIISAHTNGENGSAECNTDSEQKEDRELADEKAWEKDELIGIGISCGGPLDSRRGIIQCPPNLPGWDDVHICDMLKERYHCPVILENDANACAVAEWKFGAAKGCSNAIFLTFGTGLGAGLILDGKLYGGTSGMAGEVGHVRLFDYGPVGYGKAGSWEGFCSGGGIAQLAKMRLTEALQQNALPAWCSTTEEIDAVTAKSVAAAADAGDALALGIYRESGYALGRGLSILIDILNPEVIVIGSIYQRAEHLLAPYAEEEIQKNALRQSAQACRVIPAKLANGIGDYAAISLVAE